MRVTIHLFARLRDIVGAAELDRTTPDDATVQRVWHDLVAEFPDAAAYADSVSVAVNAEYARMETTVRNGDDIAFLPPVSGG